MLGLFGDNNSALGLDIGSRYIKGVELTGDGNEQYAVTGFGIQRIDPEQDLAQNLQAFRDQQNFNTDQVCSGVSGRSVIIRYVTMPEEEEEELETNLDEQASKYIPFEVEGASVDVERLSIEEDSPVTSDDEIRVLIVAVKKETVDGHADLIEQCGFAPRIVDVDAIALGNAFDFYLQNNEEEQEGDIVGLVDIGAEKSLVHIMDRHDSQFAREFDMGGNEFTQNISTRMGLSTQEAEEKKLSDDEEDRERIADMVKDTIDDLCHEIHLSFDFFETQFDKEVDEIFVSGGGSLIHGLEDVMKDVFGMRPVFWDPFENVELDLQRDSAEELRKSNRFLAIATGLASRVADFS